MKKKKIMNSIPAETLFKALSEAGRHIKIRKK